MHIPSGAEAPLTKGCLTYGLKPVPFMFFLGLKAPGPSGENIQRLKPTIILGMLDLRAEEAAEKAFVEPDWQ